MRAPTSCPGTLKSLCSRPHRTNRQHNRKASTRRKFNRRKAAGGVEPSPEPDAGFPGSDLAGIIKRKREQVMAAVHEYTEEELYNRLGGDDMGKVAESGAEHRFVSLIPAVKFREGRPVLVVEVAKPSPATTSSELANRARQFEAAGADALAVPTDALDTPTGLADLLSVCRAVRCPVLRRDWILHPLQVLEAKEAGAAGVMGVLTCALGTKYAFILSSYAASLGMACPVEVVNLEEVSHMQDQGAPFLGCNLGVGLSLAIPGARSEVAAGILGHLSVSSSSMVGAASLEEARKAKEAGADVIFVKKEWVAAALPPPEARSAPPPPSDQVVVEEMFGTSSDTKVEVDAALTAFVQDLKYTTSGDD